MSISANAVAGPSTPSSSSISTPTTLPNGGAGSGAGTGAHKHHRHHHFSRANVRTRSHSRSSSSPSPPPTSRRADTASGSMREKRRSFTSRPAPGGGGAGGGLGSWLNSTSSGTSTGGAHPAVGQTNSNRQGSRGRTMSSGERSRLSGEMQRGRRKGSSDVLDEDGRDGRDGRGDMRLAEHDTQGPLRLVTGDLQNLSSANDQWTTLSPVLPTPAESSMASMTDGFSTQYGASASSPAGESASEREDYFVSARGDETELEDARRRARARLRGIGGAGGAGGEQGTLPPGSAIWSGSGDEPGGNGEASLTRSASDEVDTIHTLDRSTTPVPVAPSPRPSSSTKRPALGPTQRSLPTLLPARIGIGDTRGQRPVRGATLLTRKRCEDALLLIAAGLGVYQLGTRWDEKALAGELSLLIGLCVTYSTYRIRPPKSPLSPGLPPRPLSPASMGQTGSSMRERPRSQLLNVPPHAHREEIRRSAGDDGEPLGIGSRGCVWGTEEREYRECLDDGALFALLLAPLVASGMLHDTLRRLDDAVPSLRPRAWNIEPPMVLPSTPMHSSLASTPTIKALSALATSRRNLVQLFSLCSFVLLVHLARSLYLEIKLNKTRTTVAVAMERENSEPRLSVGGTGVFWLKRGEWRRTRSVVGFAFLVTAGCIVVKIATAVIGHGVWSDMSPSDIIIATLFYQFSLYVCIRLAKRGFTLGELAVVCSAATALFMESVNLTRMKIALIRTPYIKTYRLPTPLLTFQLALIPGSLLTGFLLSPLLYLSRHLAQRPAHRLRFPDEKAKHRRLLALGFYGGAAIVCAGLVGTWTRWCLGWRDPFVWIVFWLVDGDHPWTRPGLIAYWAALAMVSVAGWSRQLIRARRHRRYVVPGTKDITMPLPAEGRISGVASQMMDAADQRLPTLSVNARRKFFHALAVIMFVPGITVDPAFTHLSFSVAFAAFNFAEYVRYFALWPFGVSVHLFLNEFLDSKDSGTAILSHFYLLAGCASPLWLEGSEVLSYFGVLVLGVGDALASIVGRRVGKVKWCAAGGKTVEGSVAFAGSVLVSTMFLWAFGMVRNFNPLPYAIATIMTALLEAFSAQNDNLILPMYGWAVATLLGV